MRGRTLAVFALALCGFAALPGQASAAISFAPELHFPVGFNPLGLAAGDVNLDGKPDLVSANAGPGTLSVLLGNGKGGFANRVDYATAGDPWAVVIADLNVDGKPDLATANNALNSVSVLLGRGDGTFGAHTDFSLGPGTVGPTSLAVGNFVQQRPSLVAASPGTSRVSVLLGDGSGAFPFTTNYDTPDPRAVAIADVNNDGKPDIATANHDDRSASVRLGIGDGQFGQRLRTVLNQRPADLAIGDVNSDGKPDLANAYDLGFTTVRFGRGDGLFGDEEAFGAGQDPSRIAIADINGDGNPDLVTSNYGSSNVTILLGDGTGSFGVHREPNASFAVGLRPQTLAIADFNLDGRPDVATASTFVDTPSVSVLLNTSKPRARFSPQGLDFGSQKVGGATQPKRIEVQSTGDARLQISEVRVVGNDPIDFDVVGETCTRGGPVRVGGSCAVNVLFSPIDTGPRLARLRIRFKGPDSPVAAQLSGTGGLQQCSGKDATIVGSPRSDRLRGTSGADVAVLGAGSDSFAGQGGGDIVCGGAGDDLLRGGRGGDLLIGGPGDDRLRGGDGEDRLRGGAGEER